MKARIVDGYIVDLSDDHDAQFHESIASQFVDLPAGAPNEIAVGWRFDGAQWIAAPAPVQDTPAPQRKILTHLQFIELGQSAGGMTDEMLVEVEANPLFKAFWIKFNMAADINPNHALTTQALGALHAGGYLPNGVQAVLDAWPTE